MNYSLTHPRLWAPLVILALALVSILISGQNQSLFLAMNAGLNYLSPVMWANLTLIADAATGFALMSFVVRKHGRVVYWAIWGAIVCAVIVRAGKVYFDQPRPPAVFSPDQFILIGEAIKTKAFPSGHTATAFFIAGIFAGLFRSVFAFTAIITLAVLLALSRIAVGVHWPADLALGAMIGWLLSNLSLVIAGSKAENGPLKQGFAVAICLIGACYLLWFDSGQPAARILQILIGLASLVASLNAAYSLWQSIQKRNTE